MGLGKSKITNEQNFSHVFFNQLIALNSLGLCNPNIFGYNYFCSLGQYANRGPILNCIYFFSYIYFFFILIYLLIFFKYLLRIHFILSHLTAVNLFQ